MYAQIDSGLIVNVIVLEDINLSHLFNDDFDHFVRIDNLEPVPGISWSYDGAVFTPPPAPEEIVE